MRQILAFTAILAATASASMAADLSKADVEAIVRDYIANHGDEVMAGVQNAQKRKQAEAVKGLIRPYSPIKGSASAPITIIEFADFECPFCFKVEPSVLQLQKQYGDKIRWVFKYLPLEFHKNAMPAAQAAAAANLQGKFWEFASEIYANQDKLGDKLFTDTAKKLGLDMKKFDADRNSESVKANIKTDLADAQNAEARGTPFFFINGEPLSGALPVGEFTKIIDAQLKAKK